MDVVHCLVDFSATDRSLVQRSPTESAATVCRRGQAKKVESGMSEMGPWLPDELTAQGTVLSR